MTRKIDYQEQKDIAIIKINRSDKKNAITQDMYKCLYDEIQKAEKDTKIKAILITGNGTDFTSGNDLTDFKNTKSPKDLTFVLQLIKLLPKIEKPLIAAVEGNAIGIGTTILLYCDIVFSSNDAIFQTPFTALGLCPEAGSSLIMPLTLGYQNAARLLLLSDKITAREAKEMGLITEITTEPVLSYAIKKGLQLTSYPSHAIKESKKLLMKIRNNFDLDKVIDNEADIFFSCLQNQETQQRLASLTENKG
jgi:enoyl-CoA hydratase/carnithine racemase